MSEINNKKTCSYRIIVQVDHVFKTLKVINDVIFFSYKYNMAPVCSHG